MSIVGESGCGKTTTGRLLTRLIEPTGGSIVLEGSDISHLSAAKMRPLRREVQMIFQDPYSSLNPRHTVGTIVGAPFKLQQVQHRTRYEACSAGSARAGGSRTLSTTTDIRMSSRVASGSASASPAH